MLQFEDIRVRFGTQDAVRDLSLHVRDRELLTLLGPSGCGKSTLIRVAAGFLRPAEGRVRMAGQDVTALPPEQRPTATVFQSHALFPHLQVVDNVAYGLRARGMGEAARRRKAEAMLERVGLEGLGSRPVQALSGGQQQRVALARALILNPAVLLLDEPLSSLDVSLRVQMRQEIRRLQQEFGLTALYVTHDQEEALSISDRVAVLQHGQVVQLDTPERLYTCPTNAFVAGFVCGANVLGEENPQFVRPDQLRLELDEAGPGRVLERQFRGALTTWLVRLPELAGHAVAEGVLRVDGPSLFAADPFIPGASVRVRRME